MIASFELFRLTPSFVPELSAKKQRSFRQFGKLEGEKSIVLQGH